MNDDKDNPLLIMIGWAIFLAGSLFSCWLTLVLFQIFWPVLVLAIPIVAIWGVATYLLKETK